MTGIERLRELVDGISPITALCGVTKSSYDRSHIETVGARLRDFLADIADQIEREQGERVSRVRILAVVTKMERHVLGHEGMEDSPVARWARELRGALDGDKHDHADEREAIAWVRKHGGLDAVKEEWQSRVPRDRYERRRQRLLDHIAECEEALGRRNERIAEMGKHVQSLTTENADMRKRLMPDGCEWPCFEDGEPVRPGDRLLDGDGDWFEAVSFMFTCDWWSIRGYQTEGFGDLNDKTRRSLEGMAYGTRVKRPAPKVLDADGVEIREKCDVWWICEGDERGVHAERLCVETICPNGLIECSPYNGGTWVYLEPSELYVNKPVPASDGKPLREGETVWNVKTGERYVVGAFAGGCVNVSDGRGGGLQLLPSQLTHERPDSLDRLAEDIGAMVVAWRSNRDLFDAQEAAAGCVGENTLGAALDGLVRRCRALAERDR